MVSVAKGIWIWGQKSACKRRIPHFPGFRELPGRDSNLRENKVEIDSLREIGSHFSTKPADLDDFGQLAVVWTRLMPQDRESLLQSAYELALRAIGTSEPFRLAEPTSYKLP